MGSSKLREKRFQALLITRPRCTKKRPLASFTRCSFVRFAYGAYVIGSVYASILTYEQLEITFYELLYSTACVSVVVKTRVYLSSGKHPSGNEYLIKISSSLKHSPLTIYFTKNEEIFKIGPSKDGYINST